MPEQDPNIRNKNFLEVALGYAEDIAKEEAQDVFNVKINLVLTVVLSMFKFLILLSLFLKESLKKLMIK